MKPKRITLRQRRAQQGFSLIVVFSLVAIMAATAAAVLLSSRTDVKVSGRQRESSLAFFSAEAGVAYTKQFLAASWDPIQFWTPVLGLAPRVQEFDVGGFTIGTTPLPTLQSRFTCSVTNNPDDPSLSPTSDTDGRVVITCTGDALDSAGTTVLATSTVQVEVEFGTASLLKGNYQAMSNQSATGVNSSKDINPVDMTQAGSSF